MKTQELLLLSICVAMGGWQAGCAGGPANSSGGSPQMLAGDSPRTKCLKKCLANYKTCVKAAKNDETKKAACTKTLSNCERLCPKPPLPNPNSATDAFQRPMYVASLALMEGLIELEASQPGAEHEIEIDETLLTASTCNGNACGCASVDYNNGTKCFVAKNSCSRRVVMRIKSGVITYKPDLQPGKTKTLKFGNACSQFINNPYHANYK